MKIKETDFMWKCYKRYWQTTEDKKVQPPGNLCYYFWTSVVGMLIKLGADTNYFLASLLSAALFLAIICIGALLSQLTSPGFSIILMPLGMFSFVYFWLIFFGRPFFKLIDWLNKKFGENVENWLAYAVIGGFFIAIVVGLCFNWDKITWERTLEVFWSIGITMGIGIGAILLYCLVLYPLATTEFFKTFWAYLKAKKDKICPVVEIPDEEFDFIKEGSEGD